MTAAWAPSARRLTIIIKSRPTGIDENRRRRLVSGGFLFSCPAVSTAEFDQITGDIFVDIARSQAGAELRQSIGKERDAADLAHIPAAAMLESGGHPIGVTAALRHALFVAAPE